MPHKIVEIHRKTNFIQDSNNDSEVKAYFDMSFKAIGSQFREFGKVYETGLTREEEGWLLPDMLGGIYPSESGPEKYEFRKKVQEFYRDICTKVPAEGLRLDIGLEQDAPLSENNPPLRLNDYLRYRHALKHVQVATSKDEADKYQHKLFYIVDKEAETKGKSVLVDIEDKAQTEYLRINKDISKVEMILTLLGVDTRKMAPTDMVLNLKTQASLLDEASDSVNKDRLEKFIAIVNDKELAAKYDIMEMVRYGILERIKSKILLAESGETIGDNLKEAVVWLLDKGNSKIVNSMYAKLDELAKDKRIKHTSPHLNDKSEKATATIND